MEAKEARAEAKLGSAKGDFSEKDAKSSKAVFDECEAPAAKASSEEKLSGDLPTLGYADARAGFRMCDRARERATRERARVRCSAPSTACDARRAHLHAAQ